MLQLQPAAIWRHHLLNHVGFRLALIVHQRGCRRRFHFNDLSWVYCNEMKWKSHWRLAIKHKFHIKQTYMIRCCSKSCPTGASSSTTCSSSIFCCLSYRKELSMWWQVRVHDSDSHGSCCWALALERSAVDWIRAPLCCIHRCTRTSWPAGAADDSASRPRSSLVEFLKFLIDEIDKKSISVISHYHHALTIISDNVVGNFGLLTARMSEQSGQHNAQHWHDD